MSALTLYNSARGHSKWHTPGVLNILKWKRAVNIFTEFGQRRIIERLFRCFWWPLDRGMSMLSTWSDTPIETPWERRKTSLNPEGGGQRRQNAAIPEHCSTSRWIMTSREVSAATRERHSSCTSKRLS